ncbi:MAG: transporter substrate-binding domain-containing protein [Lachnospira sp.]|nr:transporter substrate-binding domain-containing protein [Lachnospira sp.]
MRFKKIAAAALTAVMGFGLAACGSTSGGTASASGSSAATTAAAGATTTAASGSASGSFTTAEKGVLHVATNATFPPYESTTDDGGFTGIDIDLANAIAEKLGLTVTIDNMDFGSIVAAVSGGKSDIGMAGMSVTDERKKSVDFTDTYANSKQVIIVTDDSDIKTPDDLSKAGKIGCQEGTTGYMLCSDTPENGGYGEDHVIAYNNGIIAVQALLSGKVDAVVIDAEPAKEYVAANPGTKILDTAFADEDYAICVSKNNPQLRDAVNKALKELKDDGTVKKTIDKYISAS